MIVFFTYAFVLAVALVASAPIPGVRPTENFNHSVVLDKNYALFWNYNDTHVTFEVHVKTRGYVGFGISDKGKMAPADVIIGWVKNGTTHFADYHTTTGHQPPVRDSSQDWTLLLGMEDDTGTVLKFVRKIDTCDSAEDIIIQEDTVRVIYSYNDIDPANDTALFYHGPTTRGTKSVSLLSEFQVPDNLPSDLRHIEFLQRNFIVPNDSTTYHCVGFQLPDLGGKHHMIHYEPVITPGNELHFHHALLYRCKGINSSYDGVQGHCYQRDRPLPECYDAVIAWAIGGEPFYFPSNAGYSIGAPDDASFYILEMHYDNPKQESGIIDSSGIRISITKSLRQHDAGMLQIGHDVDWEQIVPPQQKDFLLTGYCSEGCINKGLRESHINEIKIFAGLHHAHLLGVGMKTRHFRNGTELPPLMNDPDYDFDFQEMRKLPKEIMIKPGDRFSVECTYDSTGRSRPTFGGLGTEDEMCLTFLYYYPRIKLSACLSRPALDTFTEQGAQLYGLLMGLDWNAPHVISDFETKIKNSVVNHDCVLAGTSSRGLYVASRERFVEYETTNPYQAPPSNCQSQTT